MTQRLPLQDRRLAAALMAVGVPATGFKVEPLHNTNTKEKVSSWYVETDKAKEIQQDLAQSNPDHPKALWKTEPNCPLLVALAALHNHARLTAWLAGRRPPQGSLAGPGEGTLIFRLLDLEDQSLQFCQAPAYGIRSIAAVAAFVTCGFLVSPDIQENGVFGISAASVTFPDLTPDMLMAAVRQMDDRAALQPPDLPGYPAGQHPFCYAYAAANNLRLLQPLEDAVWKHPTHFFKGATGKTAFANDAALRNNAFHRAWKQHLTGVAS